MKGNSLRQLNREEMENLLIHFDIKMTEDIVEHLGKRTRFKEEDILEFLPNLPNDYREIKNNIVVETAIYPKKRYVSVVHWNDLSKKEKSDIVSDDLLDLIEQKSDNIVLEIKQLENINKEDISFLKEYVKQLNRLI